MIGVPVRRAMVGVVLVAAALAGCAHQTRSATVAPPTATSSVSATPSASASVDPRPRAPLTGLPVDAAVAGRSAVAVAVAGTNPVGLDKADIVIEEISSPVRWLALYQSREASWVGPVVGTRPADIMALSVLRPAYGFRGGTNGMVEQVHKSALLPVDAATTSGVYSANGADVFVPTAKLRAAVKAPAAKAMLVYGDPAVPPAPGSKPAKQVVVTLPGAASQTWQYDPKTKLWRRVAGGPAIAVANVAVQVVPYKSIQLGRRDGGFVPSARVFGGGVATVLTGPVAITGKWIKPGMPQVTDFTDASSVPVRLAPGSTWVILAPAGASVAAS